MFTQTGRQTKLKGKAEWWTTDCQLEETEEVWTSTHSSFSGEPAQSNQTAEFRAEDYYIGFGVGGGVALILLVVGAVFLARYFLRRPNRVNSVKHEESSRGLHESKSSRTHVTGWVTVLHIQSPGGLLVRGFRTWLEKSPDIKNMSILLASQSAGSFPPWVLTIMSAPTGETSRESSMFISKWYEFWSCFLKYVDLKKCRWTFSLAQLVARRTKRINANYRCAPQVITAFVPILWQDLAEWWQPLSHPKTSVLSPR